VRLNPYALSLRRAELLHQKRVAEGRKAKVSRARQSTAVKAANFRRINADDFPETTEKTEEENAEETAKEEPKKEVAAPAKPAEEPKAVVAAAAAPKKKASDY